MLVNQPATINFQLGVQPASVTVDVSAEAQTLNNIGRIHRQCIQQRDHPGATHRKAAMFRLAQPAARRALSGPANDDQADQDSRSGSVNGARSDQTNVTLDGLDDNDQQHGYAFTGVLRPTLDSTEEYRVTTTNSNADSGRCSGAQVTHCHPHRGTNQFHGSGLRIQPQQLRLCQRLVQQAARVSSRASRTAPGKLIRNTFGASLGGPYQEKQTLLLRQL